MVDQCCHTVLSDGSIESSFLSQIMIGGGLLFPELSVGMIGASAMGIAGMPSTRS
jgi:hypothetical protein